MSSQPDDSDDTADNAVTEASEAAEPVTEALPPGTEKVYTFTSSGDLEGSTIKLTFTQQDDYSNLMHCEVTTTTTYEKALKLYCEAENKPEIWLIKGYTDCSTIPAGTSVKAQKVGTMNSPSKYCFLREHFKHS